MSFSQVHNVFNVDGTNCVIKVITYKGQNRVSFHRVTEACGKKTYTTAISLTIPQFNALLENIPQLTAAISGRERKERSEITRLPIAENRFLTASTMQSPDEMLVSIRQWYQLAATPRMLPTRTGVSFKLETWPAVCEALQNVREVLHGKPEASGTKRKSDIEDEPPAKSKKKEEGSVIYNDGIEEEPKHAEEIVPIGVDMHIGFD